MQDRLISFPDQEAGASGIGENQAIRGRRVEFYLGCSGANVVFEFLCLPRSCAGEKAKQESEEKQTGLLWSFHEWISSNIINSLRRCL